MKICIEYTASDIKAFKTLFFSYYFIRLGWISKKYNSLKQYSKFILLLFCILVVFNFFRPPEEINHMSYDLKWLFAILLIWGIVGIFKLCRLRIHNKLQPPQTVFIEILNNTWSISDTEGNDIYPKGRILAGRLSDYIFFLIDKRQLAFVKLSRLQETRDDFLKSVNL